MKKLNKRGFTLVELIVVIAILGVLVAILVPTLLGYAQSSRVTSANSTAANVKKFINNYLTTADSKDYGMKPSSDSETEVEIIVTNKNWTVTVGDHTMFLSGDLSWDGNGAGKFGDTISSVTSAEDELAIQLANALPDIDKAYIKCYFQAGSCKYLYITTDTNAEITMPEFSDSCWEDKMYVWDGHAQGINSDGFVVGTAPQLALATKTE